MVLMVIVLSQVENGHNMCSDTMNDFCDGLNFSANELYSTKPNSLQILLCYDELECCNPLGSKTSIHKLGTYVHARLIQLAIHYYSRVSNYHKAIPI